jgi:hypothetical protein
MAFPALNRGMTSPNADEIALPAASTPELTMSEPTEPFLIPRS